MSAYLSLIKYYTARAALNILGVFFDGLVWLLQLFYSKPKVHPYSSLLIIRPDAIGDYIVWSASAKYYREAYPFHQIIYLGNPACVEMARQSGFFDEVWPLDRKKFMLNFFYKFKTIRKLQLHFFDTIIYPVYSREFASGDAIVQRVKAKHKITAETDYAIDAKFWLRMRKKYYTVIIPKPTNFIHELEKNHYLVEKLVGRKLAAELPTLPVAKHSSTDKENYYVMFASARIPIREWPSEKFARVADYIEKKTGWKGVLVGTLADYARNQAIMQYSNACLENMAGKTNLNQLAHLIGSAKFLIGNETSGIHMAAATRTPAICLLGGGHFGRFAPYPEELIKKENYLQICVYEHMNCFGCNWNCIYTSAKNKPYPCVEKIQEDSVYRAIDKILEAIKVN